MRKPLVPRVLARAATAAALAGAVTVPTLRVPAFAANTDGSTAARPASLTTTAPHRWVYQRGYWVREDCVATGKSSGRRWQCRYNPAFNGNWHLYLWY